MAKARKYASTFAGSVWLPWYQPARWATPQPYDAMLFAPNHWPRLVEVRTNQWRTGNASTKQLASLPGHGFVKMIFMFKDGETVPKIRAWDDTTKRWVRMDTAMQTVAGVEE